ncbi:hypothetical protein DEO72_LG1g2435 [Vigna unguiculata]|uniref:Uncharacterized protein n=1 Tax=Vigna unguiculata TaxID=3917 RepID=A0A4D6KU93_VIGUN|nr:hypothetical protein DEO72_LG1g2435 [Vigna unguiculata]
MPRLRRIEAKNSHIWPQVTEDRCQNANPFIWPRVPKDRCQNANPFFFFFFPALSISLYNSISLFSLPATYTSTVATTTPLWPPSRYRCWFAAPPFPVSLIKFYLLILGFVEKGLKCRVEEGMKPGGSNVGRSGHIGDVGPKSGSRSSANQIWNEDGVGQPRISSSFPLLHEIGRFFFLIAADNTNLHLCFTVPSRDCLAVTIEGIADTAASNKGRVFQRQCKELGHFTTSTISDAEARKKCSKDVAAAASEQKMFGECRDC